MKVDFQYVQIEKSETLSETTSVRLEKLASKYHDLIKAVVYFKLDNSNTKENKVCEIQLSLPGPQLFATSTENNFEYAVKQTISDLERQLQKRKNSFKKQRKAELSL